MVDSIVAHFHTLIELLGYLGVFVVSTVSTATVFLPMPGYVAIFAGGYFLNPFLVALFGAVGSATGELTAYAIGRGGRNLMGKGDTKLVVWIARIDRWTQRWNRFLLVYVFALTPLPHDAAGLFFGAAKYSVFNFFMATFLGRLTLFLFIAFAADFVL